MTDEPWRGLLPETVKRATDSVFHYTSPAGLLGLVQNGELWATESTGMNDLAEVRQGWAFIREWLGRQSDDEAVGIMRWAAEEDGIVSTRQDIYMCCASSRGDDANQWRLYASLGRGYAVELDAAVPLSAIAAGRARPARQPREPGVHYHLGEPAANVSPWLGVLYSDAEKRTALDGLLDNARRGLEGVQRDDYEADFDYRDALGEVQFEISADLARVAQLMKADGFSGENEYRAVVTTVQDGISKFRATENGVVRYARMTASPKHHEPDDLVHKSEHENLTVPVRSVRSGPLLNHKNGLATLTAFLKENGYESADVLHSEIPLRP